MMVMIRGLYFLKNDIQPDQNYFVQTAKQSRKVLHLNEAWFFKCHMPAFHDQNYFTKSSFHLTGAQRK